jgi:hypothetical protein
MLDVNVLDKNLTYAGYQIGQGAIATAIQRISRNILNADLPLNNISSHVFALIYKDCDWWIYESHLRWGGVKKLLFKDWIKDEKPENNFVFPIPICVDTLELYAKFNPGYSLGEIGEIAFSDISKYNVEKDAPGLICSEYIALAIANHEPCFKFDVAPCKTIPLHIQMLDNQFNKNKGMQLCSKMN